MARLVVTGSHGFIGSEICRRAADHGHEVVLMIDDLSGAVRAPEPWEPFHRLSLGYPESYAESDWVGRVPCDAVIHCAAPVGAVGVLGRHCIQEIVLATHDAAMMAAHWGADFINISSSEVYGHEGVNAEGDDSAVPSRYTDRLTYAVGKLAGEHLVAQLHREHGFPVAQVRPFNVVGHGQSADKGFLVPRFALQAVAGGHLTVFGDGLQRRAFTHVEDFSHFVLRLLDYPPVEYDAGPWDAVPFNVGTATNECSVLELARLFVAFTGRGSIVTTSGRELFGKAYTEAEAGTKLPMLERALQYGWDPKWDLRRVVAHSCDAVAAMM